MGKTKNRHESGESSDSRDSHGNAENYMVTPPDGGWGWVIVVASMFNNFVVDGIGYAFGVFLGEFSEYFGASRGKTSLVGSLLCGVYLCTGPIAGALVNRYGCRPVAVVGSFISGFSFFLSTFSPNIDGLIGLYGAIGGFGFGLVYLPAVVCVGYYFEKKRALATGLAVAGSGIGTIAMPPLCRMLLETMGWKGAVMILACLILNCAVLGMLMRPLEPVKMRTHKPRKKGLVDRIRERRKRKESEPPDYEVALHKLTEAKLARQKKLEESENMSISNSRISFTKRPTSQTSDVTSSALPNSNTDSPNGTITTKEITDEPDANGHSEITKSEGNVARTERKYSVSQPKSIHQSMSDILRNRAQGLFKPPSQEITKYDYARPMYKRDIFYSGSIANLHQFRSQPSVAAYVHSITAIPRNLPKEHKSSCPIWLCPCLSKSARDTLATMLDFSLLKNPAFLIIAFANVLGMFGLFIPFVYLTDRAIQLGVDPGQAALLVSIIGITNTFGRILWGGLSDVPAIKSIWVNNGTLLVTAICITICPLCVTYQAMCAFAAVFGLFVAGFITLTSVIICDLCGLENLTTGFGLLAMFRGVTGIIAPPIGGMLYDALGSYDIPFYLGGGCLLVCFIMHSLLALPCFQRNDHTDGKDVEMAMNLNSEDEGLSETSESEDESEDDTK